MDIKKEIKESTFNKDAKIIEVKCPALSSMGSICNSVPVITSSVATSTSCKLTCENKDIATQNVLKLKN